MGRYSDNLSERLRRPLKPSIVGAIERQLARQVTQNAITHATENKPDKGKFDGSCNRTACQISISEKNWFNRNTRAYYCWRCARAINDANYRHYGGKMLCEPVIEPVGPNEMPYEDPR